MGNKCACSCCQTRPRYKQHIRAAVFNNQIESLGKFALRTPTQMNDIGRYIKKQVVHNLQNDCRVRFAMESYSCIINFFVSANKNKALSLIDDYVVECCDLLLLEGFKHNNVDYIMYAMQTLKSLLKSICDRFFLFQRLSNILDLLVKIGRSEHMETDSYYGNINGINSNSQLTIASFNKYTQNINGFTEKTIIYHALDTLKLSVEYSKNQIVETKFTELMSLFIYNLRPIDITKSTLNTTTSIDDGNKTSTDIEQIAIKGFELLCTHIAAFNNNKLHFTLKQIEQDITRYDIQYVLTLLKTISTKSRVNAIDIAKAIADTVKYKAISTSAELYKMEPTTKMIEILIKYSSFCDKSNRYQLISSLCDCIKWLDDIPDFYDPSVPIYHCQQRREKLYAGDTDNKDEDKDNKDDIIKNVKLQLPTSSFRVSASILNDKLPVLFSFANKCLECISVYVSHHDIQSTLSRAILPRLSKARSFYHKKYLLHAAIETALRQKRSLRTPLTKSILRYILQCPFLNAETMNELHRNELIDLSHSLFQNLALIPSKHRQYHNKKKSSLSFLQNVLEFEHLMSKRLFITSEEKPNLSGIDRQSKKWIYCVIYKSITAYTDTESVPMYILKSFSRSINIILESAQNDDVLSDDLKVIFSFLISLQSFAITLNETADEISFGVLIHTWILSLLFVLARCFNQSAPNTQELISRLKDVQHRRQDSHQMWSHFFIDEFGLIQTSNTLKDKLTIQKTIRDESVRIPPIFSDEQSNDTFVDDPEITDEDMVVARQKSRSLPSKTCIIDAVTHIIAFDEILPIIAKCLNIETKKEREQWIVEASSRYLVDADYRDLFKSPTSLSGPQLYNEASSVAHSESGELTMRIVDAASIPSEIYFGFDVFDPPTTVNKHSVRNLFDDDFENKRLKWRKNILIKKKITSQEYFNDVIDVYSAQIDHNERVNDIYFNNLEHVISASFDSKRLLHHDESYYYMNEDQDDVNKGSMALLGYKYEAFTNINDADAAQYLLIDQDLITNGDIDHNEVQNVMDNSSLNKEKSKILTKEFEYRLGLKQFDFESEYFGVEYELENMNLNDVFDKVVIDTDYKYNDYKYNDTESDISEDSVDDNTKKKKKKKKKKRNFNRKKGQMAKNFKAFSKKLRDGLEDMKQRGKHNQTDSNDIQMSHLDVKRQHSLPQTQNDAIYDDEYVFYRQQMFAKEAGSLTDGDEPHHLNNPIKVPSTSNTPNKPNKQKINKMNHFNSANNINIHHFNKRKRNKRHHRKHSSSTDLSSVNTETMNNNNIIEEEEPHLYNSDAE